MTSQDHHPILGSALTLLVKSDQIDEAAAIAAALPAAAPPKLEVRPTAEAFVEAAKIM